MMPGSDLAHCQHARAALLAASPIGIPDHVNFPVRNSSGEDQPGKIEIRRLNTLRGLAALIVITSHFANETGFHTSLGAGAGQLGVMLFFLLSGFLMAYLYYGQPANARNVRAFFIARFARVVPLFYVVVITSFLLTQFAPPPYDTLIYGISDVHMLLSHMLFLHGESVLWTIPPEIQFYALFGMVWGLRERFGGGLPMLLALIFVIDFFLGFREDTLSFAGLVLTSTLCKALPYFMAGSVMGCCYLRWQVPDRFRSHFYVLALLIIPLLYPQIFSWITGHQHALWADVGVLLIVTAVFFAVVFLVPESNRLIENRVGDFLGRISYSIYLLHLPVLAQLIRLGLTGSVSGFLLFFLTTCAIAFASFALIEAPSRKFIRRVFQ